MSTSPSLPSPFRYELEVPSDGRIQLDVPLPEGSHVTVLVVEQSVTDYQDLLAATASSLDFWDNPLDDEDWNDA